MLPLLLLLAGAAATPVQRPLQLIPVAPPEASVTTNSTALRPLVLWHGLGDTAHSSGMESFADYVRDTYPGIFVYSVVVPEDGSVNDERNAGFWGVGEEQAQMGCDQIALVPELADGFDAIGFSQGGLFLRWYEQYCDGPRMRNLITFGTPHYGISALIPCPDPPTLSCRLAERAAKAGIYSTWAQTHLIQAQYYRDPPRIDEFLFANTFLRDMNAEGFFDHRTDRGEGGRGLGRLENLVLLGFEDDTTLYPKESAQWGTVSPENGTIVPLKDQMLYYDDWIGVKKLDKKGRLHLGSCPGQHMDLGGEGGCADKAVKKWIGWRK